MTTESDDYHSTTELEYFMQDAHDSDVEIKLLDKDGTLLSSISEHDYNDHEPIEEQLRTVHYGKFFMDDPATNGYYIMNSHKNHQNDKLKYLINKMCDAPHLYIQQRDSNNSCLQWMVNYMLFIDQYFSFKYFYELSLPFIIEFVLIFGVFCANQISILCIIFIYGIISKQIQLAIFTLICTLISFGMLHILCLFHVFPFRSLPNVIYNIDEYGFNIKRRINVRYLYYKNKDKSVSSFPCWNTSNVTIFCLSHYIYFNEAFIFLFIPYVIIARCYFAFNYLMDSIFSILFAIFIVGIMYNIVPQSALIIADEIITEISISLFS